MPVAEYLIAVLTPLLRHPDKLVVTQGEDGLGLLITVVCHKEDMGSIIGKGGVTAKAMRHLVRIVGIKNNVRVSVRINEPDGRPYNPPKREYQTDRELVA